MHVMELNFFLKFTLKHFQTGGGGAPALDPPLISNQYASTKINPYVIFKDQSRHARYHVRLNFMHM